MSRRWLTLAILLAGTFMVLLDVAILNVAIPTIQHNLQATDAQIQLIVAGYQLSYAVCLITGGRLGDLYGRRRMFLLGLLGFTVSSALCGLAPTPLLLIGARVVQGLTAALLYPQVASIIQVTFTPIERGTAFGFFGATIGLGTIVGPLLGGFLVSVNLFGLSWRPIFLVNLPVGVLVLAATAFLLDESYGERGRRLDLAGVGMASLGLLLLTIPVVEGREAGWPWWAFVSLAASFPVLAWFIGYERQLMLRGGVPLLDLRLFRDRAFSVGMVLGVVFFLGVISFFLYFAIFLQRGLGFLPLRSALTIVPFQTMSFIFSLLSARITRRLGRGVLSLSTGLLTCGMALIVVIVWLRGVALVGPELIPALAMCGTGFGLFIGPSLSLVLAGVQPSNAGAAAGVLATVQQVSAAFGVAGIGALFFTLLGDRLAQPDPAVYVQAISWTLPIHVVIFATCFFLVRLLPSTSVALVPEPPPVEA